MAVVSARDSARFLASGWRQSPVILVHGSDEGGVRDSVARLLAAATGPDFDPMNLVVLDGETLATDPPRLADELRTFGLFGGLRIVHVRGASKTPVAAVERAAEDPSAETLLILEAGELNKASPLRVLCERHRAIAALPCYADTARDLHGLIDQILGAENLTITREAREALTAELGADRGLSRSEIEKLTLYARGEQEVTLTMVQTIVADAGRHESTALIDNALSGAMALIEPEANRLFAAGINPAAILAQLSGHLFLLRRALRNGQAADEFIRQRRIHFSRSAAITRTLAQWNEDRINRALAQVADATLQTRTTPRLAEALTIRTLWALARMAGTRR